MDINETQLKTMLEMQDTLNQILRKDWVTAGWNYCRASYLEGAEAVEHHGWKWWKHQVRDDAQLQMEIVDIWHFYLSRYLQQHGGDHGQAFDTIMYENQLAPIVIFDTREYHLDKMNTLEKLDLLVGLGAANRISLQVIGSLCVDTGLTWNVLFQQYVKKNLLNIFRQKNGYKDGTYHKTWFDQEDNVFLVSEADKLDSTENDYAEKLWQALVVTYQNALAFEQEKAKKKQN
jgi:hypothetical protein